MRMQNIVIGKKELRDEIRDVEKQIAELEEIEDSSQYLWKRTKPTDNEMYWYVNYQGFEVIKSWWYGDKADNENFDMCNVFRTEEEALIHLRKRTALVELRKYACDLNSSGDKWGISYDSKTKTIEVLPLNSVNRSVLAFSSKEVAERAIDEVGRKRIVKYLFGEGDRDRIKELKEKLVSLRKELTELVTKEAREAGYWIPSDGDTYWYISTYTRIGKGVWDIMREDSGRLAVGNVFKTKEDVEFELERLRVLSLIKPFTCKFRKTDDSPLYVITTTVDGGVTVCSYDYICLADSTVYFDSKEQALKAVEKVGADDIRKYLFGLDD